ncbi:MAG: serine/threonine protein kinase [Planctomycetes bacterium]|nr:serine/threonine protein kinase [Planctomycetota bacterium]
MPPCEPRIDLLKSDLFGRVELVHLNDSHPASNSGAAGGIQTMPTQWVRRDTSCARWWVKPLARYLAGRECRALLALSELPRVPKLLSWKKGILERSWQPGSPLQLAAAPGPAYFAAAFRLLVQLHRRGVAHNDLAKEPNWLVDEHGQPGLIDFQLASTHRRRGRRFRLCAREDIRHLLKHKRTYCPQALTPRELKILANPSAAARLWRATGKRIYLLITRRIFGWSDREGAGDRNH